MTTETTLQSTTADKIARLVDQVAEVFSNANVDEMLDRVKRFKPLIKTISTLAKTLAITIKLKALSGPRPEGQAQAQQASDMRKFAELPQYKQEVLIGRFRKKVRRLAEEGHKARSEKLNAALTAKNYDQAMILARLYGMIFTA
jgi:anaerobic glycerol-3-phosphate dehydrogenase